MPDPVIDLRSDTVTKPSQEMRRAMSEAAVGDDVFMEDPSVNRLQECAAEIFGKEAALYVPSGTMGNLTSILAQTERGQEVICEGQGHIYNYEMASMSAIAGVLPRVIETDDGIMNWDQIENAIRPKVYYRSQTALVSLENTHNMAGGTVYPTAQVDEICEKAHERGLRVHLDGARVFNAATALGQDVGTITRNFDSVQFCLSKGLGGPVGSLIVGTRSFIERCRRFRKMLGGGMRQAGVIAAAGLVALEKGPGRLHEDHDNAKHLAERLAAIPGLEIDPARVQTNIVIYGIGETGLDSDRYLEELERRGVLAVPVDRARVRMVAHLDVTREEVDKAVDIVADMVGEKVR
jgi:threonine aldolase